MAAARAAFEGYAALAVEERVALLERIADGLGQRLDALAEAISLEMGAPLWFAKRVHATAGVAHFKQGAAILKTYAFEKDRGSTRIRREPFGVCAMITPWNWPINQIACKVAPALAAGCTIVLKPSETAPLSAQIFAGVLDEAGVPAGVFNLVHGDGAGVGARLAEHPDVDLVSFTGSTRAGVEVARAAAASVKRVTLELGGKSPSVFLEDADFEKLIPASIMAVMYNSGQSCNAPARLIVPKARVAEVEALALKACDAITVGAPETAGITIGPLANERQFKKVRALIEKGLNEGARLVCGGFDRPQGAEHGYFVRPTVLGDVKSNMTVAREEIFGPVVTIQSFGGEDEAVAIANDTPYGLSAWVSSRDLGRARGVARRIRAGDVHINGAGPDFAAPFGGYKQSGNGREWGVEGFEEFLETKALLGFTPAQKPGR